MSSSFQVVLSGSELTPASPDKPQKAKLGQSSERRPRWNFEIKVPDTASGPAPAVHFLPFGSKQLREERKSLLFSLITLSAAAKCFEAE